MIGIACVGATLKLSRSPSQIASVASAHAGELAFACFDDKLPSCGLGCMSTAPLGRLADQVVSALSGDPAGLDLLATMQVQRLGVDANQPADFLLPDGKAGQRTRVHASDEWSFRYHIDEVLFPGSLVSLDGRDHPVAP